MDGAHAKFRGKSPTVMGGLKRESRGKTFSLDLVEVAFRAGGIKTRVAS